MLTVAFNQFIRPTASYNALRKGQSIDISIEERGTKRVRRSIDTSMMETIDDDGKMTHLDDCP